MFGAASGAGLLIGLTVGAWLGLPMALLAAVLTWWRLRFRPSPAASIWRRQAARQRRTAGVLGPLGEEGYLILHDITLPGWPGPLRSLQGIWVAAPRQLADVVRHGSTVAQARSSWPPPGCLRSSDQRPERASNPASRRTAMTLHVAVERSKSDAARARTHESMRQQIRFPRRLSRRDALPTGICTAAIPGIRPARSHWS